MRNRRGGFTLIELLVVITLIAGLMGLGILLLGQANKNRDVVLTSNRVQAVAAALSKLSGKGPGAYDMDVSTETLKLRGPNGEKVGADAGMPNDTNIGIESVVVALHLNGVNVELGLETDAFANTDQDNMAKNPTRMPGDGLMEIVDAWGHPLAYFYGPEMKLWEKYSKYVMGESQRIAKAKPWQNEVTGDYLKADSFQLFSAGPDGEFNTEDDIKSW
jgi:prepilin-type N-terminal cleavage/methylation domain-containing protein